MAGGQEYEVTSLPLIRVTHALKSLSRAPWCNGAVLQINVLGSEKLA
jgi:hypothetical protein